MSALSPAQLAMLRYWGLNMSMVGYRWIGFNYSSVERLRFEAVVGEVPAKAYAAWMIATVLLYFVALAVSLAAFVGPLVFIYPSGTPMPEAVFFPAMAGMVIFALTFGMPLAMVLAGRLVDRLCKVPPITEVAGDAELYTKIRLQIGRLAILGMAATGLLTWFSSSFGVDTGRYDSVVRWLQFAAMA